jgi:predicted transcriptional regulator
MNHDNGELRWGTKALDVLAYTVEYSGAVVAKDIAFHLGTSIDAIRVQISRLRKQGLVDEGSPYKATDKGKALYDRVLTAESIDIG